MLSDWRDSVSLVRLFTITERKAGKLMEELRAQLREAQDEFVTAARAELGVDEEAKPKS